MPTPTGVMDLIDPAAIQGTRFSGPLLSGAPEDGDAGVAMLSKRVKFNYTHGNFNIPVKFPAGAILLAMFTAVDTAFNGTTPTVELDQTSGGAIMMAAAVSLAAATVIETTFTKMLATNNTAYLKVAAGASTAGSATVIIQYSVPAKVAQS